MRICESVLYKSTTKQQNGDFHNLASDFLTPFPLHLDVVEEGSFLVLGFNDFDDRGEVTNILMTSKDQSNQQNMA